MELEHQDDLQGGVKTITGFARLIGTKDELRIVDNPYYAWDHLGPGEMAVAEGRRKEVVL